MYRFYCRPALSGIDSRPSIPKQPAARAIAGIRWTLSLRRYLKLLAVLQAVFLVAYGVVAGTAVAPSKPRAEILAIPPAPRAQPAPRPITKQEVQQLMAGNNLLNLRNSVLDIRQGNACYTVQTSIDPNLQNSLLQRLDLKNSRTIGIVIMDARDGRVLAMVGHDKTDPSRNPCLESRFPAASVFKIITAAAAVETCDLNPGSMMNYSGGKYTLTQSQIHAKSPKNATRISLKDSFAQSINPVFGKLGAHALGREVIESYAEAFGFNREIDFELPTRPSRIELSNDAFGLAEVASGYNRTTRISPLHGALMAAALVNQGRLIDPTIVDWVAAEDGRTIYQSQAVFQKQAIDPETSRVLCELMQETVRSGTASREFHKHVDARIFSRLAIGGKTGHISDGSPDTRFDWFVGYAREDQGPGRIVFSVVVAHEELIGTQASAYAAMAIKEYFHSRFAAVEPTGRRSPRS
jgi:peptidoglycan glycosyltransferase